MPEEITEVQESAAPAEVVAAGLEATNAVELGATTVGEPVAAGAELLLGGRDGGRVASSAVSPRLGPIGLAIVRREAQVGAQLRVEGSATTATVDELP